MLKKKLMLIMLMLAIAISFMPLAAHADTGATTLVKTKTVTIKPGKTYKTPKFTISEKMVFQVPIEAWLSPKDKASYIKKGGYKLTLKTAKGKSKGTFSTSLKGYDKHEDHWYSNWIYFYASDDMTDPGYATGKYYYTIKNTTKQTIKVKYSIKGYTEIASTADLPEEIDWSGGVYYDEAIIGTVGPGLPLMESVTCDDEEVNVSEWDIYADGRLRVYPYADFPESEIRTVTVYVKLKNREEPYEVRMILKGEGADEDDDEWDDEEDE